MARKRPPNDDPILARLPVLDGYKFLDPCLILAPLGRGGMGTVYRGHHIDLEIDLAVKCLRPELALDGEYVSRFKREARMTAQLNHENLIRVYGVYEHNDVYAMAMEFVEGENARQRVTRKGPLSSGEAIAIVSAAALGLAAAHRQNIVHRDIKPDNILISTLGQVKVADLGLAKQSSAEGMTMTQQVAGTPNYMPPEQFQDFKNVGPAGDVFSLGATLYFLLTGEKPYKGTTPEEIWYQKALAPYPDLKTKVPGISPELVRILERCGEKKPEDRFQDAAELAGLLRDAVASPTDLKDQFATVIADSESSSLSPPPSAAVAKIRRQVRSQSSGLWRRKRKVRLYAGVGGAVVLLILLATLIFMRTPDDKPPPPPPNPAVAAVADGARNLAEELRANNLSLTELGAIEKKAVSLRIDPNCSEATREVLLELEDDAQSRQVALHRDAGDVGQAIEISTRRLGRDSSSRDAAMVHESLVAAHAAELRAGFRLGTIDRPLRPPATVELTGTVHPMTKELSVGENRVAVDPVAHTFSVEVEVAPNQTEFKFDLVGSGETKAQTTASLADVGLVLDPEPPSLTLEWPPENAWSQPTVTVRGVVEEDHLDKLTVAGAETSPKEVSPVEVSPDGRFEHTLTLRTEPQRQWIVVTATEKCCETSTVQRLVVRVDDAAPTILDVTPTSGSKVGRTETIEFRVEDNGEIDKVEVNGKPAKAGNNGSYAAEVDFTETAQQTVVISVTDKAGNDDTLTHALLRDAKGPLFSDISPAPGAKPQPGRLEISGRVSDSSGPISLRVTLSGEQADVDLEADGEWTAVFEDVSTGPVSVRLVAEDHFGNRTTESLELTIQKKAPEFAGFELIQATQNSRNPEYTHERSGLTFVFIPGGRFEMGSPDDEPGRNGDEGPRRKVTVSSFLMAKHEVSNADWARFVQRRLTDARRAQLPKTTVRWTECVDVCQKLGLSLPTEAQWEYASRGGREAESWSVPVEEIHCEQRSTDGPKDVRELSTNPFGIQGMHGNVREWCADQYDATAYFRLAAQNGDQPRVADESLNALNGDTELKVVRGGAWMDPKAACRSAARLPHHYSGSGEIGFRPVFNISRREASATRLDARIANLWPTQDDLPRDLSGFEYVGVNDRGIPEYRQSESGLVFVLIPGTDLESTFLLSKYEVPWAIWARYTNSTVPRGRGPYPADKTSWEDSLRFCRRLGLTLPTQKQWAFACRAGTTTRFAFGDVVERFQVNHAASSERPGSPSRRQQLATLIRSLPKDVTTEVAPSKSISVYPLNGFGLAHMHGNVAEWCLDRDGRMAIYRGGHWLRPPAECEWDAVARAPANTAPTGVGLRPVRLLWELDNSLAAAYEDRELRARFPDRLPKIDGMSLISTGTTQSAPYPEYVHLVSGLEFVLLPGAKEVFIGDPTFQNRSEADSPTRLDQPLSPRRTLSVSHRQVRSVARGLESQRQGTARNREEGGSWRRSPDRVGHAGAGGAVLQSLRFPTANRGAMGIRLSRWIRRSLQPRQRTGMQPTRTSVLTDPSPSM